MSSPTSASRLILTDALRSCHIAYHQIATDGLSLLARLLFVHGVDVQSMTCTLDICCRNANGDLELDEALRSLEQHDLLQCTGVDPLAFSVTRKGRAKRRQTIRAIRRMSEGPTAAEHLFACEVTLRFYLMQDND